MKLPELEFPKGSRIHNVFHVSCLKKAVGQYVTVATDLLPLNKEGNLILELAEIIEVCEKTLQNDTVKEYLVRWRHLSLDDATWEGEPFSSTRHCICLRTSIIWDGRTVMFLL